MKLHQRYIVHLQRLHALFRAQFQRIALRKILRPQKRRGLLFKAFEQIQVRSPPRECGGDEIEASPTPPHAVAYFGEGPPFFPKFLEVFDKIH